MTEKQQQMKALYSMSLRELIEKANKNGIQRDDVVDIIKEDNTFILVYFKSVTP